MATGDLRRPTRRQRQQLDIEVGAAEAITGLQLAVVLGKGSGGDPRAGAEKVFVDAGLLERPGVLILVDVPRRHVEVVTGPAALSRVPDEASARAVAAMTERFGAGDLVGGVTAGIAVIVDAAGPGEAPSGTTDLPNVLDDG